jgi:TatD DNase family protein
MKNARGYDFHCHVDLYQSPVAVIEHCEREKIATIAVTTTPKAWPQNVSWTTQCRFVKPAVGFHPELVATRLHEASLLLEYMEKSSFVGEIGLDGSPPHRASLTAQRKVFGCVLDTAEARGGHVLSIHSRGAASEVIDMLMKKVTPQRVLPILHWYSGNMGSLRKAIEHGCYFSVNEQMLHSAGGRAILKLIPYDRLLTETDGPFTTKDNCPRQPADVITLLPKLAALRDIDVQCLKATIAENAEKVLGFAAP